MKTIQGRRRRRRERERGGGRGGEEEEAGRHYQLETSEVRTRNTSRGRSSSAVTALRRKRKHPVNLFPTPHH